MPPYKKGQAEELVQAHKQLMYACKVFRLWLHALSVSQHKIAVMQVPAGGTQAAAHGSDPAGSVTDLRHSLEQEIALEDPYCGEIAVRNISKPFISSDEVLEVASWQL